MTFSAIPIYAFRSIELEKKKQKLAELRRQREERKSALVDTIKKDVRAYIVKNK